MRDLTINTSPPTHAHPRPPTRTQIQTFSPSASASSGMGPSADSCSLIGSAGDDAASVNSQLARSCSLSSDIAANEGDDGLELASSGGDAVRAPPRQRKVVQEILQGGVVRSDMQGARAQQDGELDDAPDPTDLDVAYTVRGFSGCANTDVDFQAEAGIEFPLTPLTPPLLTPSPFPSPLSPSLCRPLPNLSPKKQMSSPPAGCAATRPA